MQNHAGVTESPPDNPVGAPIDLLLRTFAGSTVALTLLFITNTVLTHWWAWPGAGAFLGQLGWFGVEPPDSELAGGGVIQGAIQALGYPGIVALVAVYVFVTPRRALRAEAQSFAALSAYIVRAAFWIVVIVGVVDMMISFLRVEGFLSHFISDTLSNELGRPSFRGYYVHYPLMVLALIIAFFVRSVGFSWLALLVVLAEVQIVLSRFVFSYEQAFMGDLVRFWYAALFLFASSHALVHDAHVRVDVLYVHFSLRGKAWANVLGSVLLGMPLCWTILGTGMAGKGSSVLSPLLSFEISQSGFGMYVKYLMAGFLIVFATSMLVQFASYFLTSAADLRGEPGHEDETPDSAV